jgi:glycosyltransferase involved in cell wall biosynthesis
MLQALAKDGNRVSVLGFADEAEQAESAAYLKSLCETVELVAPPRKSAGRLQALFTTLPYGAWRFTCPILRRRVEQELSTGRYDAVLCDGVYNTVNLPGKPAIPVWLNKDDVAHVLLQRYVALEKNPVKAAYGWLEYRKMRRWEGRACSEVTAVLMCSEADCEVLRPVAPRARLTVIPNVVDTEHYQAAGSGDDRTVLYVGALDWFPNRDAAEFFIVEVFPELRRLVPDARFVVAGRKPAEDFRCRWAHDLGVIFTGSVPDIRDIIATAAVCVVPLRIGSGTRMKILEAAAMSKAIVSTKIGAEGLDLINGEEILLEDDPLAFARGVAGLLQDPSRRRTLGEAARRRIERDYSFPVLREALLRMVMTAKNPAAGEKAPVVST